MDSCVGVDPAVLAMNQVTPADGKGRDGWSRGGDGVFRWESRR